MIGPISRILARYLAGGLVLLGLLVPEDAHIISTDPDVILVIGGALTFTIEFAYGLAKKKGWNL